MKTTKQVKQQAEQMVNEGACIELDWMIRPVPIAAIRWEPDGMVWFLLGGQDQHDVHKQTAARMMAPHAKGIAFMDDDNNMIAYMAPVDEWPDLTPGQKETIRDLLKQRDRALQNETVRKEFEDFFRTAI